MNIIGNNQKLLAAAILAAGCAAAVVATASGPAAADPSPPPGPAPAPHMTTARAAHPLPQLAAACSVPQTVYMGAGFDVQLTGFLAQQAFVEVSDPGTPGVWVGVVDVPGPGQATVWVNTPIPAGVPAGAHTLWVYDMNDNINPQNETIPSAKCPFNFSPIPTAAPAPQS